MPFWCLQISLQKTSRFHCYFGRNDDLMKSFQHLLTFSKVRIFWEGHNIWKNPPLKIWHYSVTSNFTRIFFSNLWPSQNLQTLVFCRIYFMKPWFRLAGTIRIIRRYKTTWALLWSFGLRYTANCCRVNAGAWVQWLVQYDWILIILFK